MFKETSSKWRETFLKFFPKKFLKFLPELRVNFVAVQSGLKLSYLFDCFQADSAILTRWLHSLADEKLVSSDILVLNLDGTLFITNGKEASELLENFPTDEVCFVDVSKELVIPREMDMKSKEAIEVLNHFREILKFLVDVKSRPEYFPEYSLPVHMNRTSITGLLLAFPVIYWFNGEDVCLSMQELINSKLSFRSSESRKSFDIYSFTYPAHLNDFCSAIISSWKERTCLKAKSLHIDYEYSCSPTTLPTVAL